MIRQQQKNRADEPSKQPSELAAASRREWDGDSILRAEFCDNFSTYLAYREAMASGAVRIQGEVPRHV